jgi:hypothetical protein
MMVGLLRLTLVVATAGLLSAPASAEEAEPAALAKALKNTAVTLQEG